MIKKIKKQYLFVMLLCFFKVVFSANEGDGFSVEPNIEPHYPASMEIETTENQEPFSLPLDSLLASQDENKSEINTEIMTPATMMEPITTMPSESEQKTDFIEDNNNLDAHANTTNQEAITTAPLMKTSTPLTLTEQTETVSEEMDTFKSDIDTDLQQNGFEEEQPSDIEVKEVEEADLSEPAAVAPTITFNNSLPTIQIAVGASFKLSQLPDTEKYFVKDEEHKHCLESTVEADGKTTYTIFIKPGLTTDHFTVFKGHGTDNSQTDLKPAFHIQIIGLSDINEQQKTMEERIQQAKIDQENQEEAFLQNFIKMFDEFRKESAKIWFNINHSKQMEKAKGVIHDPIVLTEGEETHLATGSFATVQSTNPIVSSGKLEHPTPLDKKNWNISITGNKRGTTIVHYSVDGTDHTQPVIVHKKLKAAQ